MTDNQRIAHQRRTFLKGMAAASGAAALTLASSNAVAASIEEGPEADERAKSKGYRKTSHVKDFYASARI